MASDTAIGFVGLGTMGRPIAAHIRAAFGPMTVHDTDAGALAGVAGPGVTVASGAAAVGDACAVVFTCLPTPAIVEAVIAGADGIARGARCRTIVDLSTNGPAVTARIAAHLAARGIALVDAPVTGGSARAVSGTLTALVAGAPAAVADVLGMIEAFSGRVIRVGDAPGQAQAVKLINNALSAVSLAACAQAIFVSRAFGINPALTFEAVNHGSGRSVASEDKIPRHVLTETFDYGFPLSGTVKDLDACLDMADALGVDASLVRHSRDLYAQVADRIGGHADMTTIAREDPAHADR